MRTVPLAATIIAAGISLSAAFAEPEPQRPTETPPAATASFIERETWCQRYAAWVVAQNPTQGAVPADVRPTQRFENEFNSCKPDPRDYERVTRDEISRLPTAPPRDSG